MPHIILEHTQNLNSEINYQELFKALTDNLTELGIVTNNKAIKCRYNACHEYYLADPKDIYIHLEIGLLEGRAAEKLIELGQKSKEILQSFFASETKSHPECFSVEIREINRTFYQH